MEAVNDKSKQLRLRSSKYIKSNVSSCRKTTAEQVVAGDELQRQFSKISSEVPRCASQLETLLYGVLFAAAFVYGAADFYANIGRQPQLALSAEQLLPGWLAEWKEAYSIPLELEMMAGYKFFFAACLGFLLLSQLTLRRAPRWSHYLATAGYTFWVTVILIGPRKSVYLLLFYCAEMVLSYYSVAGVWILGVAALMLQNSDDWISALNGGGTGEGGFMESMYFPISGYLYCRSISAGLTLNQMLSQQRREAADDAQPSSLIQFLCRHLPRALAYGFYLPWHFVGPILTYPEFCQQAEKADRLVWDRKLAMLLAWRACRMLVWLLVLQALHHFLPVGAFLHSIESYGLVPYKRLVFSMYLHGQNFMLVYLQLYGWPGLVSRLNGIELPHWPDCISRVYTYRRMWRVFDRGLASFMHRHIYVPLGGSRRGAVRQVAAVAASFAFVSLYHGDTDSVRVWAGLNALHLLLEIAACSVYESKIKAWLCRHLRPANHQRLVAYITVFNLAITSCFIFVFLIGDTSGLQFIVEIFKPLLLYRPWWHLALALLLPYFIVQISVRYEECVERKAKMKN